MRYKSAMAGIAKYKSRPASPMNQWVRDALEAANMTQQALADALSRVEGLGTYDRSMVHKMTGSRRVRGEEAVAISQITGHPLPESEDDLEFEQMYRKLSQENRTVIRTIVRNLLGGQKDRGQ
ncbi:hypothetical protein LOS78_01710 [Paracoccus sp. MA]|uniref:hypothetical protein n=1 Tax=Paracoccus sp. MA TaxID=2895796 RepID=UPI001E3E251C|nr:hypothetical protein [Paracoccus sp. MA]UFM64215.1 hypothetical protein LOS78_01710 [Paracoccus sp. MA]